MNAALRATLLVPVLAMALGACGSSDDEASDAALTPSEAANAESGDPAAAAKREFKANKSKRKPPAGVEIPAGPLAEARKAAAALPPEEEPPSSEGRQSKRAGISGFSGPITRAPNAQRTPGSTVYLYRWNGAQWTDTGRRATSNSVSSYTISGQPSQYYYAIYASKVLSYCYYNYNAGRYEGTRLIYGGWSNYVLASPNTTHRLGAQMTHQRSIPCS